MVGTLLFLAAGAFVANAVYKRRDLSVQIKGDYMEVRFKYNDRDKFYDTIDYIKELDPSAAFRKAGNDNYWLMKKRPTVIKKLERYGFPIYRRFDMDTISFNRDKFYADTPWKDEVITQDKKIWKDRDDEMWDFQRESLQFLQWNKGVGIIGHQMSLGKTAIGLCFLKEDMKEHLPALIIVPASVKTQWADEWESVLHQRVHVLYGRQTYSLPKDTNVIINYDILHNWKDELIKVKFKTVIADEFHKCGNMTTQRTRAYRSIAAKSPNFIAMSGTAIRSRPSQIYPTVNLIAPDKFPTARSFKDRYCVFEIDRWSGFEKETKGCRNIGELQKHLSTIMFRKERTDPDVIKDIGIKGKRGKRIPIHIKVDLTGYNKLVNGFKDSYGQSTALVQKEIRNTLSRTAFDLKEADSMKWVEDFLESGEKLVIFCYHRKVMDAICKRFPKDSVKIDGSVTGRAREKAAKKFQEEKNLGVFQILAMGEGIDWIAKVCSFGAFIELPDTIADVEQAEMRFDRPGAKSDHILYYYLLAKGTIDEKKMESLDQGKMTFDKIVRGRTETDEEDLLKGLFE